MFRQFVLFVLLCPLLAAPLRAEQFTVATYNIENFATHFLGFHLKQAAAKASPADPAATDARWQQVIREIDAYNREDQWEIAETILDPGFNPDILMIQEGPSQSDLLYFNKRWLKDAYETVLVLPANVNPHRVQTLAVMMKPGFKILDTMDRYHLEEDSIPNGRDNRLFARGPSFLKVRSPGGYVFWIGNTHQKSKGVRLPQSPATAPASTQPMNEADEADEADPSTDVASGAPQSRRALREMLQRQANAWRLREAKRTHAIIKEIEAHGPADVMLVGDMNDDVGLDKIEQLDGQDCMALLIGPPEAKLHLVTRPLVEEKAISFGGYWQPRHRSLIDHVIVTDSMKPRIKSVEVFTGALARVASDHYPVLVKIKGGSVTVQP